ncbi:MAG: 4Fe-4S binding protein [Desulfobacterota bacterium]|nr:4Fe-4S binding protein [Thermodesulfobacteriota bacterium]MDW8001883.1 4Fe-4S binding protein [Deltaproteobacteria bacterium]
MPPNIDMDRCSGCGMCDKICPLDVIHFDSEKNMPIVKYADECWHCGSCRLECPMGAIKIFFPVEMLY